MSQDRRLSQISRRLIEPPADEPDEPTAPGEVSTPDEQATDYTPPLARVANHLPPLDDEELTYATARLAGASQADAARAARPEYLSSPRTTAERHAFRLSLRPQVVAWLHHATVARLNQGLTTIVEHSAELARLREISLRASALNAAVLAEVSRGKLAGLYGGFGTLIDQGRSTDDVDLAAIVADIELPEHTKNDVKTPLPTPNGCAVKAKI